jgi:hypothetical protein
MGEYRCYFPCIVYDDPLEDYQPSSGGGGGWGDRQD